MPRLSLVVALKERITGLPDYSLWFTKLESTDTTVASPVESPSRLSVVAAKSRLRGVLHGVDDIGCIVLGVTEYGVLAHKNVVNSIRAAAVDEVPGLGRERLRMDGTVFEAFAVDEAAEASLQKFVIPSSVLGFLLSALCLGSMRGASSVLVLASFGQLVAVGLVFDAGYQYSAVLVIMLPALLLSPLGKVIASRNLLHQLHSGAS